MSIDNNIREILELYSRRVDYRINNRPNKFSSIDSTNIERFVGQARNAFCNDTMTMYIRKDSKSVTLQHYGEYCALANASAEIFCEAVENLPLGEIEILLDSLKLYLKTNNIDVFENNKKFDQIYELAKMPMSATRKRCISLPWEATVEALL